MNMPARPINANWRRYSKMKQNYDHEFLNPYEDFENLSQYIRPFLPWEQIGEPEHEGKNYDVGYEHELKEYVIFKAVAIVEQSFRNLLVFLIDDLKLNVHEVVGKQNKISISINELDKILTDKPTKGLLIAESLTSRINKPYTINETFSKILKLDFHDTLSNLYTIYNNEDNHGLSSINFVGGLKTLSKIFENENEDSEPYSKEFLRIFKLRNDIAHNTKHMAFYDNDSMLKNEELDLHKWLSSVLAYVSFGTKLIAFYGIFRPRSQLVHEYTLESTEEIKRFFESSFGTSIEKVSEYIKLQQKKYKSNNSDYD